MLAEGAAAICPSKFPDSVFASSPERVYPRVPRPFPARRPTLWGSGGKCNAQSARFCASEHSTSSTRWWISILHRRELFLERLRSDPRYPSFFVEWQAIWRGFRLLWESPMPIAIWRGDIDFRSRGGYIYIFFSFLSEFAALGRYIERPQVHAIAYAPRDISWSSFEEAKKRRSTSYPSILQ